MKHSPETQAIYQQEAAEQLSLVEELILELEGAPADKETLNRLFRVFHTIKGSGSMFGFDAIADFTHHLETILDEVRQGRLSFDKPLADLTLAAKDCIADMLGDPGRQAPEPIYRRLKAASDGISTPTKPLTEVAPATDNAQAPASGEKHSARFDIRLQLASDVFSRGLDPLMLLRDLQTLGSCEIEAFSEQIPPLHLLNPEECLLGWKIRLTSSCGLNAIKDVFIFVEDDSRISITEVSSAPATQADAPVPTPASSASRRNDPVVRVPSSRLDQLVSLVGELVINHSRLQQLGRRQEIPDFSSAVEDLERLISGLRDQVLGIRMTPIGTTFGRFRRLVRDLSAELGREVDFITSGEETELDRNMLDQLSEPLVHLIRNSIDHGIARPEERVRLGKPRCGTIRLSASHEGAHVIIRLEDDGAGLEAGAIRSRAIAQGLIAPDEDLSETELHKLVFLPGFSTARTVTTVSGRGVGMDVVKRQIEMLRGSVTLSSTPGRGTTVTLILPLTLAIIDGLLVGVGADNYILPLSAVEENVEIERDACATGNGRNLISVRGELVPFIRLRELFDVPGTPPAIGRVVIVRAHGQRVGLVVDRILGTHQTVVQSLGYFYRHAVHVSGATILGDGQVALILDVAGLVSEINRFAGVAPAPAA